MSGTGGAEVRPPRPGAAVVVLGLLVLGACAGDAIGPLSTAPTDDLAPSQRTAATVARPDTPPPCAPAAVDVGAATSVGDAAPTIEVRVVNAGEDRCDVDLGASAAIDEDMEPDVWLEPGASAVLLVEGATCADGAVDTVEIDVNGAPRTVALPERACRWRLIAFYPDA